MADSGRVRFERAAGRVTASFAGETVADSARVVMLHETGYPPVAYFPAADVAMSRLRATDRRTRCPHKGEASYWTVAAGGEAAENAAWTYRAPLPAAAAIAGHVAFYSDRVAVRREDGDA